MTLLLDNHTEEPLPEEGLYEHIVSAALTYEGFTQAVEVSLCLVTEEEIHQINRRFRGIDRPTDVLSFPQLTFEEGEEWEKNEKGEVLLGDIIISLPRARAQAEEYGHSLRRELAFLTAHSMLHLLGYDHMTEEEEKEMFARQEAILLAAGVPRA